MSQKEIIIGLSNGLEARPVAMFVQIAGQFSSQINVDYKGRKVNAKSIMGMMSLGIAKGESVIIQIDGTDEETAMETITEYLTGQMETA